MSFQVYPREPPAVRQGLMSLSAIETEKLVEFRGAQESLIPDDQKPRFSRSSHLQRPASQRGLSADQQIAQRERLGRRGNMLLSEVIFMVLVLSFIVILVAFVAKQSSAGRVVEEQTAKKIALMLDAARPGMELTLYVGDVLKKMPPEASWKGIVISDGNVRVKLSEKGGYSYGYFTAGNIDYRIDGEYLVVNLR